MYTTDFILSIESIVLIEIYAVNNAIDQSLIRAKNKLYSYNTR